MLLFRRQRSTYLYTHLRDLKTRRDKGKREKPAQHDIPADLPKAVSGFFALCFFFFCMVFFGMYLYSIQPKHSDKREKAWHMEIEPGR